MDLYALKMYALATFTQARDAELQSLVHQPHTYRRITHIRARLASCMSLRTENVCTANIHTGAGCGATVFGASASHI